MAVRYQPIEMIGTGGMASVWKARDNLLGRTVAVKRLLPHLAADPAAAERFQREARAAARLAHPGIVTVFDTGVDAEGPFIVLELIQGMTLAEHLVTSGPLDPTAVAGIVSQVGSALDHAHDAGVVHRDIKPGNLILDPDGRARITDFGIARAIDDPGTVTESGQMVGTITYLAPEIVEGAPATPASDIYSLAAVTHELLTGKPPFSAATPAALLDAVRTEPPPGLAGIAPDQMATAVTAAMSKNPSERPSRAGEYAAALAGASTVVMSAAVGRASPPLGLSSEEPTVVAPAVSEPPPPAEPAPSRKAYWSIIAGLVAVLALAAAALSNDLPPAGEERRDTAAMATTVPVAVTTVPPAPSTTATTAPTTTTTTIPTTTTAPTPESIAEEIAAFLAGLVPPEFRPSETRQIEERLERVMEQWADGDREDLIREFDRLFEEVAELDDSPEREELTSRLVELAELMGFEVERINQDGDGGDD